MKRFIHLALLLIVSIVAGQRLMAKVDTLTILHVGDTHSHLAPGGNRDATLQGNIGGIARAATMIGTLKATEPNVIALHAGDAFVGDLFFNHYFGVPELRILAALGFDAMTLGNHEFDLTPAVLMQALDSGFVAGGFPVLSANAMLDSPQVAPLRHYVTPYTIREIGGIRVGIFGLTTPATNLISLPSPVVIDDRIVEIASSMVDTLGAKGCDVIILLSHLGVHIDMAVAAAVPGIDAIIGGHDHYLYTEPIAIRNPLGDTTWIAQAGPFYHHIGEMKLGIDNGRVSLLEYRLLPLDLSVPEEPGVKAVVQGLIEGIEQTYGPLYSTKITNCSEDFGEVADDLTELGDKDTPTGNLVADAFRVTTGVQIGIEPAGSTAEPFYRGAVTPDDAFRVVGYGFNTANGLGFRMVTLDLPGRSLLGGIEFGLSDIETGDDYLLQVSGMRYSYNPSAPVGARLASATVGGLPVDTNATYTIATNEFMLAFLDLLQLPYSNVHILGDTTEFQMLAAYLAGFDTIRPYTDGRIKAVTPSSVAERGEPASLQLGNYPDPFTGQTTIRFHNSAMADVRVEIFNSLGDRVALLAEGKMPEGIHSVLFDGGGLPAGGYLCRVRIGERSQVRVIHLVK
jgi:5'-nucleotidase